MFFRTFATIIITLGACLTVAAQNTYKSLKPGTSTRSDANRVLGHPITQVSETLFEYKAPLMVEKLYVQFNRESFVIDRIEVICNLPKGCTGFTLQLARPKVSAPVDAESQIEIGSDHRNVKYHGAPDHMVITDGDANFRGARIAIYSPSLYQAALASVRESRSSTDKPASETKPPKETRTASDPRTELGLRIKNLIDFIRLFGVVTKELEKDLDVALSQSGQVAAQAAARANQSRTSVIESLQNMGKSLNKLEEQFRGAPNLEHPYQSLQGISELCARAEEKAAANRFHEAGRILLEISDKLIDAMENM